MKMMNYQVLQFLLLTLFFTYMNGAVIQEDLASTVKLLKEQVTALLEHRQEDYNALENSLKRTMEKNTELIVLKNEIKQLRKELLYLRNNNNNSPTPSSSSSSSSSLLSNLNNGWTNEAKNDKLRLRWLESTVSELQAELNEVLRGKNTSEELAERSIIKSDIDLLRADINAYNNGIKIINDRMDKLEEQLDIVKMDVYAVKERNKQLSRNFNDFADQISSLRTEFKSSKCTTCKEQSSSEDDSLFKNEIFQPISPSEPLHSLHHTRHIYSRLPTAVRRLDDRLKKMEHKIGMVSRKRALMEKRVVYEDSDNLAQRVHILESISRDINEKVRNVSHELKANKNFGQSVVHIFESVGTLEERIVANQSEIKREIIKLDVNAQRAAAKLSLTREELSNLKRAVQALSVSASKLQEKGDTQQEAIDKLNETMGKVNVGLSIARAENLTKELEHVEDKYRLMVDALPGNCEEKDGLTLLAPGPGAPLLAACRKGWIVIGRRVDGTVDFDRSWNDYATGFGSPVSEFWAGNEALHRLSQDNCTRLKIELNDIEGNYWIANYENFSVDSEENGYRLRVSGFSGNATDAMEYQNDMKFSAKDRDLDISSTDCAANYHGGWWFSHCQHANLNGRYSLGLTWYRSDINQWMAVASAELLVQRKQQCL